MSVLRVKVGAYKLIVKYYKRKKKKIIFGEIKLSRFGILFGEL